MAEHKLTYQPYGSDGILINWPQEISVDILKDILQFKQYIEIELHEQIHYINNAYCSLLIRYKSSESTFSSFRAKLTELYKKATNEVRIAPNHWKIPVCYEPIFGVDLDVISKENRLSFEEIIQKHTTQEYLVYFIGFLPGFLYLGGLDEKLHIERRANPRLKVPKGAVAIGGSQTGIYPQESPGGWHIIGNTPVNMFDRTNDKPCFASAGDIVSFTSVNLEEYKYLEDKIKKNEFSLSTYSND